MIPRMYHTLVVLVLACTLSPAQSRPSKCGVERWAVKTLADPEASKIRPTVTDTTIEILRQQIPPADLHDVPDHRRSYVEFNRYRVHALLLGFKRENDRDYHLVLASPSDRTVTMVAEIPSGTCTPASISKQESTLQTWLLKKFGHPAATGRMLKLHPPRAVIVEGVGFFDFLHGQTGVAPNGIEIHPVTLITLEAPQSWSLPSPNNCPPGFELYLVHFQMPEDPLHPNKSLCRPVTVSTLGR